MEFYRIVRCRNSVYAPRGDFDSERDHTLSQRRRYWRRETVRRWRCRGQKTYHGGAQPWHHIHTPLFPRSTDISVVPYSTHLATAQLRVQLIQLPSHYPMRLRRIYRNLHEILPVLDRMESSTSRLTENCLCIRKQRVHASPIREKQITPQRNPMGRPPSACPKMSSEGRGLLSGVQAKDGGRRTIGWCQFAIEASTSIPTASDILRTDGTECHG